MKTLLQRREFTLFLIMLVASILIGILAPGFLTLSTLHGVLTNALVLMALATGTMFVILTRSIDVSGGSILGLSAVVLGMALKAGFSLPLAIVLCLGSGVLAGLINGILVAVLGIPAIIATLGTLGRGAAAEEQQEGQGRGGAARRRAGGDGRGGVFHVTSVAVGFRTWQATTGGL